MSTSEDEYTTVRLPKELMDVIDNIITSGVGSYKSRAEFIKEALRRRFEELHMLTPAPEPLPQLEHFNLDEQGVRILDRALANGSTRGRIIDVYFKPDKVFCGYCGAEDCRHVQFALSLPKVQKILSEKGWEIRKKIKET